MDFLELQSFVTICDCRNITEAARRLYITQPALSRRIQDMERELGVTLFVRKSKGIDVTEAGQSLYDDAVQLLAQKQAFSEKVERLQNGVVGTLRIATVPCMPRLPIMRCIAAMARDYPLVAQTFVSDLSTGIPAMLTNRELDVALCCKSEINGRRDIPCEILAEGGITFLVGRGHRFWSRERITVEDLAGETIRVFNPPSQSVAAAAILFLKRRCPSIKNVFTCASIDECVFYAMTGQAISLCGSFPEEWLPETQDVARSIPLDCPRQDMAALVAAYNPDNPLALTFIDFLKREYSRK